MQIIGAAGHMNSNFSSSWQEFGHLKGQKKKSKASILSTLVLLAAQQH